VRILVVEDDRKVAAFIHDGLSREGYAVDVLHDGSLAGDQAQVYDYDAAVLDLMLPGRSGFQVLRDIRARKTELPVLILTAKDSVEDRVAGLDAGADDYMVKPFALAELAARLRALLRRGSSREVAPLRSPGRALPCTCDTSSDALPWSRSLAASLAGVDLIVNESRTS